MTRSSVPWLAVVGLLAAGALPLALGSRLARSARDTFQPEPHLVRGLQLESADLELPGADGTTARLHARGLRLEAAETFGLVSTAKALVAREAILRAHDRDWPEWHVARVQMRGADGPFEWFGPGRILHADGREDAIRGGRGELRIERGRPILVEPAR